MAKLLNKGRIVARKIRHSRLLGNAEWLWNSVRPLYHAIWNHAAGGVPIEVRGGPRLLIPAEYGGMGWEDYETEEVKKLSEWITANPEGLVLDIGAAIGFYSVITLYASRNTRVIAFDADLSSLRATERVCSLAPGNRLQVIHCLVSSEHKGGSLDEALSATARALANSGVTGDLGTTRYVCIGDTAEASIPVYSIDGLFLAGDTSRPLLLKCDVEGAELLVLRGARRLLERDAPPLLLSVHPPALPTYGATVDAVRDLLSTLGYRIDVFAVDHEEHWWCTHPRTAAAGRH